MMRYQCHRGGILPPHLPGLGGGSLWFAHRSGEARVQGEGGHAR